MTTSQQKAINPLALLVFGAVCISFAPIFVKWIGEARMGPTPMAFWRTFFGAVTLILIALLRGDSLRLPARLYKFAAMAGFVFFLDLFVWHRSVLFAGAGMSTILGNTQVFASALLSWLLFKERLSLRFFIAAVSGIVGVVLLVGVFAEDIAFTPRYLHGITFGLTTGLCYASYIISLKAAGHREKIPHVVPFMAWVSMTSAFFLGAASLIEGGPVLPPDTSSWLLLISLGVLAQAIGWWAITTGLGPTVASKAGLILLLQPILAMVWGVIFFAEQFTLTQVIGAGVTLTAIYYGGLRK